MPLVVKDRVKETTTSTGTGTITLAGAAAGFQSFSVVGDGNTTYYAIVDDANSAWEVGIGTYTSSGTTLSRDSVLESSNSGNLVDFAAGQKFVFVTYPAEKSVDLDTAQTLTNKTINANNNTVTNVSLTTGITGTLGVANGGTGATSLTAENVILGDGTNPVKFVAPGSNGNVLTSNGTTWTSAAPAGAMVYPGAGIAVSTGSAWGTSLTAPTGSIVGTTDTQTLTNKTLTDPAIIGAILENVFTITDGAAFEVDPSNGTIQLITLGASRTPKATNFAAGESVTLMVDDGSAYAITWTDSTWGAGGVVWVGGAAPSLVTSGYTVIEFWKVGTQVYGALVGSVA